MAQPVNCGSGTGPTGTVPSSTTSSSSSRVYDPDLSHLHAADFEHIYEPAEDTYLMWDALYADKAFILEHLRPPPSPSTATPATHSSTTSASTSVINSIPPTPVPICFEIGSGSGALITYLSKLLKDSSVSALYYATDINPHACKATRDTLRNNIHPKPTDPSPTTSSSSSSSPSPSPAPTTCCYDVVRCDLFSSFSLRLSHRISLLLFNPPYVPTPTSELTSHRDDLTASWAGGERGRVVLDRMMGRVEEMMVREGGVMYVVFVKENEPEEVREEMRGRGWESVIVKERKASNEALQIVRFWRAAGSANSKPTPTNVAASGSSTSTLASSVSSIPPPSSSEQVYNWCVVGSGQIAHDFLLATSSHPRVRMYSLLSRSSTSSSALALCNQFSIPHLHTDINVAFNDPAVDIIYVATPNSNHFTDTLAAIQAKKPVLVEKTLVLNSIQAHQIYQQAQMSQVLVVEAIWSRFLPFSLKLRSLVCDQQILGTIHLVTADIGFAFPRLVENVYSAKLGGGSLLAVGIYAINFASMIYKGQKPSKIVSVGERTDSGVDGHVCVSLQYGANQFANLVSSILYDTHRTEAVIIGEKGKITIRDPFCWICSTEIVVELKGQTAEVLKFESVAVGDRKFRLGGSEKLVYEAVEMMRCVDRGDRESVVQPLKESVTIIETMDEVRRQMGVTYPEDEASGTS